MNKDIITFANIETEKHNFHYLKSLIMMDDVDIDIIQISKDFLPGKIIINTLLVTKMMIIKTRHCV